MNNDMRLFTWRRLGGRLLVVAAALAMLLGVGVATGHGDRAEAASFAGCNWTGTCSVHFTKWETETIATFGGAWATSRFHLPWWVQATIDSGAKWATDHGYCVSLEYNLFVPWTWTWYYRC